jgi:hypothetical protein
VVVSLSPTSQGKSPDDASISPLLRHFPAQPVVAINHLIYFSISRSKFRPGIGASVHIGNYPLAHLIMLKLLSGS